MSNDVLHLRPTRFGTDPAITDDYEVIWRGMHIGRIFKHPGLASGQPDWCWEIILPNKSSPPHHRGVCTNIDECKGRFRAAWSNVRRMLTEGEIIIMRRHLADIERRGRWPRNP
jgi:hypothetical protein